MDEIYRNLSQIGLWRLPDCPEEECTEIRVMELWLKHKSGVVSAEAERIIPVSQLDTELEQVSRSPNGKKQSLIARFVWVEVEAEPRAAELKPPTNVSQSVREKLLRKFGLTLAYDYLWTSVASVTALPHISNPQEEQRCYSFSYAPKLGAVWSHTCFVSEPVRPPLTQGLIITQKDKPEQPHNTLPLKDISEHHLKDLIQKALVVPPHQICPWQPNLCSHGLFLGFSLALVLGVQIDETKEKIRKNISHIEGITGHTIFKGRERVKLKTEYLALYSATASGYATKLASAGRKAKTLERLLQFITKHLDEETSNNSTPIQDGLTAYGSNGKPQQQIQEDGNKLLRSHVAVLENRLVNQKDDLEYTLTRVKVQIDALFSLITQKDSLHNIVLSQSMKLLAVVTMFFLPGSFISSLFSTAVFDWDNRSLAKGHLSIPLTPQFSLYWVLTVPLTILTFVAYFSWFAVQQKKSNLRFEAAGDLLSKKQSSSSIHLERSLPLRAMTRAWTDSSLSKESSSDIV